MMFSDSPVESTGFLVTTKETKKEKELGCQTEAELSVEKETQTALTRDFSDQTDTLLGLKEPPDYDAEKLASFLNKIYPHLLEELNKNDWSVNANKFDSNQDEHVTNLCNIESEKCQEKIVSCLSWNSTGMTLAISFCDPFHESWCTHTGQIHIHTTTTHELFNLPQTNILHTDSCPKCISFHPTKPSLVAAGLYNGQVVVWDLKDDDVIFSVGGLQFPIHSDVITSIAWVFDGAYFVTSGKDGIIVFWKIFMKEIQPHKRFFISSQYCNIGRRVINDNAEILSLGFWQDPKESDFVIATGGGGILHCSSESTENIPLKPEFLDPVLMKYEPHSGIITCIKCSSNDTFATCATDSEIRVYSSREKVPIHIIHSQFPLLGIEWIYNVADIILCWGLSHSVVFYKTSTKERLDTHTIKLSNPETQVVAAKLNKQRRGVIAIGTEKGETSIWMVPQICL